jgi:hypothetical protein
VRTEFQQQPIHSASQLEQQLQLEQQQPIVSASTTLPLTSFNKIGVVLPVNVAEKLQKYGLKIDTTVHNTPCISLKYLQDSFSSCERMGWNGHVCSELQNVCDNMFGNDVFQSSESRQDAISRMNEPSFVLHQSSDLQLDQIAM